MEIDFRLRGSFKFLFSSYIFHPEVNNISLQDALTGQDTGAKNLTSIVFTLLSLRTVKEPVVAVQVSVFCFAGEYEISVSDLKRW